MKSRKFSLYLITFAICGSLHAMEKQRENLLSKTIIFDEYSGLQQDDILNTLEGLDDKLKYPIVKMLDDKISLTVIGIELKKLRDFSTKLKALIDDIQINEKLIKFFAVKFFGNPSITNQIKVINLMDMPIKKDILREKENDPEWLKNKNFLFALFDLIKNSNPISSDRNEYVHIIERLLYKNRNLINTVDEQKNTPLHIAAKLGLYTTVEQILKTAESVKNYNIINAQNVNGDTALILAMEKYPEIAYMLVKNRALDIPNNNTTPSAIRSKKIKELRAAPSKDNDYLADLYEQIPDFIRKI